MPFALRYFACLVYEIVLVVSLLIIFMVLPLTLWATYTSHVSSPIISYLWSYVLMSIYFVWHWTRGGQTLAMRAWRIRLLTAEHAPVKIHQALLRFIVAGPSIAVAALGLLWALIDKQHLFLHDRLSHTRLVVVKK